LGLAAWIGRNRYLDTALVLSWMLLLAGVLALPYVTDSPSHGDERTRNTVRLALVYYAAAVTLMMCLGPAEWLAVAGWGRIARWCWTLSWASFLVHLGMAFHYYHHWSHADAVAHTEEVSGFGPGIWFSHLFTLLWTADVAYWWLWSQRYAVRSPWIDRLLHGYLAFIVFNATVVYEEGGIRWAGVLLFAELALGFWFRWKWQRIPQARLSGRL
jgi:hypothetical protein